MKKQTFLLSFWASLLLVPVAFAQTPPSTVNPGRVGADITNRIEKRQKIRTPEAQMGVLQEAPEDAKKISFTLKKVNILGADKISGEVLEKTYESYIGKNITLDKIYSIANDITRIYRDSGYLLSRAVVPQQEITDGVVRIQVVEGFINSFTIQGETRGSDALIREYAQKIVDSGTLTSDKLERYLLLMNDLPGITVRSVLSPSTTKTGGADLTLVAEEKRFNASASIDNYGNDYLGPIRLIGNAQFNSLFALGEQINTTILAAPNNGELYYFYGSYTAPIGNEGTTLGASIAQTATDPSLPGALGGAQGIKGESTNLSLVGEHPFIRDRDENLYGRMKFDYTRSKTDYDPAFNSLETEDNIRALRLSASYALLDRYAGYNTLDVELSQGLDILNASESNDPKDLSRANGENDFQKINLTASRLQNIYGPINLYAAIDGQYSDDPLLATEEFGFGGPVFGRGYDISEITGEHGIAGKFELVFTNLIDLPDIQEYQLYSFYDVGRVWNKEVVAGEDKVTSAASAGFGTRITFSPRVSGDAFVAWPLTRKRSSDNGDDADDFQVKFNLTTKF